MKHKICNKKRGDKEESTVLLKKVYVFTIKIKKQLLIF